MARIDDLRAQWDDTVGQYLIASRGMTQAPPGSRLAGGPLSGRLAMAEPPPAGRGAITIGGGPTPAGQLLVGEGIRRAVSSLWPASWWPSSAGTPAPGADALFGSQAFARAYPGLANLGANYRAGGLLGTLLGAQVPNTGALFPTGSAPLMVGESAPSVATPGLFGTGGPGVPTWLSNLASRWGGGAGALGGGVAAAADAGAFAGSASAAQGAIGPALEGGGAAGGGLGPLGPVLGGLGTAYNLFRGFSNLGTPTSTGTLVGTGVGAGAGALLGTLAFPGVGTLAGALMGGSLGGSAGGLLGGLFGSPGQYGPKREAAASQAGGTLGAISSALGSAKTPAETFATFQQFAGPVRVEVYFPPQIAAALGVAGPPRNVGGAGNEPPAGQYVTTQFSALSPQQFSQFLTLWQTNPEARTWLVGSGDVPYLPYDQAVAVANQARGIAQQALDRTVIGIGGTPAMPPPPSPAVLADRAAVAAAAEAEFNRQQAEMIEANNRQLAISG